MLLIPPLTLHPGQLGLDASRGLDEGHRVVVVLLHAGGHGEHVGVEDDVLGREADLFGEDAVRPPADLELALDGVGLAALVKGHHHHRRAVAAHQRGLAAEGVLAFLQADGVDDALALDARRPASITLHLELSIMNGHAGDVRLGGDQVQEPDHGPLGIEHALVHVDVDDLRAAVDLLAGDRHRVLVALRP